MALLSLCNPAVPTSFLCCFDLWLPQFSFIDQVIRILSSAICSILREGTSQKNFFTGQISDPVSKAITDHARALSPLK